MTIYRHRFRPAPASMVDSRRKPDRAFSLPRSRVNIDHRRSIGAGGFRIPHGTQEPGANRAAQPDRAKLLPLAPSRLRACFKNIPGGLAAGRGVWRRCSSVTDF